VPRGDVAGGSPPQEQERARLYHLLNWHSVVRRNRIGVSPALRVRQLRGFMVAGAGERA